MANYNNVIRTNYFHVKNKEEFKKFMACVYGNSDEIQVWEKMDENGNPVFGFGVYGSIAGVQIEVNREENIKCSYDEFIYGLQKHVADDDAIVILEAGSEKMRYVVGEAFIITSNECACLDITELATNRVAKMLHNPVWETEYEG